MRFVITTLLLCLLLALDATAQHAFYTQQYDKYNMLGSYGTTEYGMLFEVMFSHELPMNNTLLVGGRYLFPSSYTDRYRALSQIECKETAPKVFFGGLYHKLPLTPRDHFYIGGVYRRAFSSIYYKPTGEVMADFFCNGYLLDFGFVKSFKGVFSLLFGTMYDSISTTTEFLYGNGKTKEIDEKWIGKLGLIISNIKYVDIALITTIPFNGEKAGFQIAATFHPDRNPSPKQQAGLPQPQPQQPESTKEPSLTPLDIH